MQLTRRGGALAVLVFLLGSASAQWIAVRPGDTLVRLARAHGTTVEAIMEANALTNDFLEAGQTLRLPSDPIIEHATAVSVRVAPGDNLWRIAQAYGTTIAAIKEANGLDDDVLEIGQIIMIPAAIPMQPPVLRTAAAIPSTPVSAAVTTRSPTDAIVSALVVEGLLAESGPGGTHVVQANETLFGIANRYGVSLEALIVWNGLERGDLIRVGQTLRLSAEVERQLIVAPGDTLWSIAAQAGISLEALAAHNDLDPQARLYVGRELRIPSSVGTANVGGAAASDRSGLPPRSEDPDAALKVALTPPSTTMVWPVVGPITSRFGYRQLRIANTNMHYGVDIGGRTGDPIRAAATGRVTFSGWRGGFGNLVIVTQGDTEYWYAHASQLHVEVGEMIAAGEVIARVGDTGNTTGPHLHFEIRVGGNPIDPLPVLESRARR